MCSVHLVLCHTMLLNLLVHSFGTLLLHIIAGTKLHGRTHSLCCGCDTAYVRRSTQTPGTGIRTPKNKTKCDFWPKTISRPPRSGLHDMCLQTLRVSQCTYCLLPMVPIAYHDYYSCWLVDLNPRAALKQSSVSSVAKPEIRAARLERPQRANC